MMSYVKRNSVLIVDDERANISALRSILDSQYTIYVSSDGQDAVETAEEFIPDVILLDIIMPDMDGFAVISALKKSERTQNIPVIFITGLDSSESEERGLVLGAADYIHKPFNSSVVKLRVNNQIKLLEQQRQQALVTSVSHVFLSDDFIDTLLAQTLKLIGEFMDLSQLLLYRFDDDSNSFVCRSEWHSPKHPTQSHIGDEFVLNDTMDSILKNLLSVNKGDLCLSSNNPFFKEEMKPQRKNLCNFITTPIFIKGKLCAVLDFSREDDGSEWSDGEINLALIVSDVFSGVFERETMERQFSIVENAPYPVLSITADAVAEYINPAVTAVTGYKKNDIIANGLSIIFGEEMLEDIKETYISDALWNGAAFFEADIFHKNGEKRILFISLFQTGKNNLGIVMKDLTKIRSLEIENKKIFLDGLTGLYNRRFFDESITRIIKSLSRSGSVLSLMMIDIDFFKKYNDTYGHSAGDDCLRKVADALKKCIIRADDFVARYGGEEFVVVLPNTDETGSLNVAEKLLLSIRECNIPHEANEAADHVTISIGAATGIALHTHTAEDFIKKADDMLYNSKKDGRNRYSCQNI
ncbi:MAG: diguanylate cyclase [Oscillospiraceae bacterium]|nr:diguanylate cyclase [Oscillospiraceae bacterium]